MLFFSFSVSPQESKTGLIEGREQRKRDAEFGPIWVPSKPCVLFSHFTGVDWSNRWTDALLTPPHPQLDLRIVRAQSAELIFVFS